MATVLLPVSVKAGYVDRTGGCAAPKGHFLSPDSLAKGVFLSKIP